MSEVIIFHDRCHDGITALWAALQRYPNAEPYPARYESPPDLDRLRGRDVVIVDFSWKRGPLLAVADASASIQVLDHHKTAQVELEGLDFCVFDMERSGAGLAWDELVGGERPRLIDYVEDRDLWRFSLPNCREVHAACNSYPLTLEQRAILMGRDIEGLVTEGRAILRYHDRLVESAAQWAQRETIAGFDVPSIQCPNIELVSDLGHRLAKGEAFAAIWVVKEDGSVAYSLRSSDDGEDVGAIAASFGGGGHRGAAGFTRSA